MQKTSYRKLAESRTSLEALLSKLNLELESDTWLYRAYGIVETLADIYKDDEKSKKFLSKENGSGDVYFAFLDIGIIHDILPHIENEEAGILKRKLQRVLKMDMPSLETNQSNEARNTLWELNLCARLRMAGVKAALGNPNPDILSHFGDRKYYFQCKRIFSPKQNSLLKNIRKAAQQLRSDLQNEDDNARGIIALSVERPLTKGNLMLVTDSQEAAKEKLRAPLWRLKSMYGHYWLDSKDIIREPRIVAVFLHLLAPGIVEDQNIMIRGSQIDVHNTWSYDDRYKIAMKDFQPLQKYLNF